MKEFGPLFVVILKFCGDLFVDVLFSFKSDFWVSCGNFIRAVRCSYFMCKEEKV